jgi:SOS-response transcriptional repressor LexA
METFAEFLRKRMSERNLKINQLAKLSGVSSSEVSRMATGQRKSPNPQILRKLAPVLRVSFDSLLKIAYPEKQVVQEKVPARLVSEVSQLAKEIAKYTAKELSETYITGKLKFIGFENAENLRSENEIKEADFDFNNVLEANFAVVVKGDSLKDINIMDGDILTVKKQKEITKGQLVLANCDERPTIQLRSNLNCKNLEIIGVVTSICRKSR